MCCDVALTYGISRGDEDTESLEVVLDSALSHTKMPHVDVVKAAHTDDDDKQAEAAGKTFTSGHRILIYLLHIVMMLKI